MTINIDQTIADLQTYANALDQNGHFAVIVNQDWYTPLLVLTKSDSDLNLWDVLREKLDSCESHFARVNSYACGKNIYSETLNPTEPEESKPEYKQITMDGVTYDLVPVG